MNYTREEVETYVEEEDVKFIRLAFTDVFGKSKNVSIMPSELKRAFDEGIAIDSSAIAGFGGEVHSDLLLHPDPATLAPLPWRPDHGRVVRMFCSVTRPDGTVIDADTRSLLIEAQNRAQAKGFTFSFGSEIEFYLFLRDQNGQPTLIPYDRAGYMDIAPDDKGENVRREICLTLEQMGITPEASHHEEGPGQNEIDFHYAQPLEAADNAVTFRNVVSTLAASSGLFASFNPKPLEDESANGMHLNFSVTGQNDTGQNDRDVMRPAIAGVLSHITEMTLFLNPDEASYRRFGSRKAPRYVSWSEENRSQLIRIPAATGAYRRAELRSPDPLCNPYLAFTLLIDACLDGIDRNLVLPDAANVNLYTASSDVTSKFRALPLTLEMAKQEAIKSRFVSEYLPASVFRAYTK